MRFETCPRNFRQFLLVPLFALTVSCSGSDDPAPTPEPELPESKLTLEDNQLSFTKDANQSKTITFTTDQKWKIEIPGDSWLRADITAGDPGENITVTLYVKSANDDYPVRKKEVLIETTSGKYKYARVKAKQTGINDQELPYIYVANAGDMKRALEAIPGYANIEALYVKGNIGPADFATLNSMRRLNE